MTKPKKRTCFPAGSLRWLLLLAALLFPWPTQAAEPDDDYVEILATIHQADALKASGYADAALAKYRQAQVELYAFRKAHPDWHLKVMAYRINYLAEKLAPAPEKAPAPAANPTPLMEAEAPASPGAKK